MICSSRPEGLRCQPAGMYWDRARQDPRIRIACIAIAPPVQGANTTIAKHVTFVKPFSRTYELEVLYMMPRPRAMHGLRYDSLKIDSISTLTSSILVGPSIQIWNHTLVNFDFHRCHNRHSHTVWFLLQCEYSASAYVAGATFH